MLKDDYVSNMEETNLELTDALEITENNNHELIMKIKDLKMKKKDVEV